MLRWATLRNSATKDSDAASIWPTFLAALMIFSIAVVGMAVGAIFANKPVTGSCGGLSAMSGSDDGSECGVCSKPVTDCVERDTAESAEKQLNSRSRMSRWTGFMRLDPIEAEHLTTVLTS